MTDAPETIWAWGNPPIYCSRSDSGNQRDATPCRRADLPLTPAQLMADERVRALVEAAKVVHHSFWYESDGVIRGMYELERAIAAMEGQ